MLFLECSFFLFAEEKKHLLVHSKFCCHPRCSFSIKLSERIQLCKASLVSQNNNNNSNNNSNKNNSYNNSSNNQTWLVADYLEGFVTKCESLRACVRASKCQSACVRERESDSVRHTSNAAISTSNLNGLPVNFIPSKTDPRIFFPELIKSEISMKSKLC